MRSDVEARKRLPDEVYHLPPDMGDEDSQKSFSTTGGTEIYQRFAFVTWKQAGIFERSAVYEFLGPLIVSRQANP